MRNSSFELLRILSMILIMAHHIIVFSFRLCNYFPDPVVEIPSLGVYFLNSLCIVGVNVFIFITGWFGISSIKKSILRLLPLFIGSLIILYFIKSSFVFSDAIHHWWFLVHFFLLILCSPMLEKLLIHSNNKELALYTLSLFIINSVFGWKFN